MNIEDINKKVRELNKLKKLLKIIITEDDTLEEIVYKKYLELESVTIVSKYINNLGYRINKRKYIPNDITQIITDKKMVIKNNDLKQIVSKIFNSHKKAKRVF